MITIDGSQGEGGGQILRSSLALSMATGRAFRMQNIRAGRARPGLMRQHLTCVNAAAAISGGVVTGAEVGSREITFTPRLVRGGEYHFPIGTAGGTMLVLQAILPALLRAPEPSVVSVEGGTHNGMAPSYEFFARVLLPLLCRSGVVVRARLDRHGFYPAGGGRVVVEIEPTSQPRAIEIDERGEASALSATAIMSQLPEDIADRELTVLRDRLGIATENLHVRRVERPIGPGNAVFVEVPFGNITELFCEIGAVGRSAEAVANELANEVSRYLAQPSAVGPYLADQLMVPLAVLGGGRYATVPLTEHSRTNMATLGIFGVRASAEALGVVTIEPLS
jgi:RNA 3'-terminal phosphate cyclase (ATP)